MVFSYLKGHLSRWFVLDQFHSQAMIHCLGLLPLLLCWKKMLINVFFLLVRFNFKHPHTPHNLFPNLSSILCVYWREWVHHLMKMIGLANSPEQLNINTMTQRGFLKKHFWTPALTNPHIHLPFWVSLVEQTSVEMVKLSLELTDKPPPLPDKLLELRLSAAALWGSQWWWRVEGNDK